MWRTNRNSQSMATQRNGNQCTDDIFSKSLDIDGYFKVQSFCFAAIGLSPKVSETGDGKKSRLVQNYILHIVPPLAGTGFCFAILHYCNDNMSDVSKVTDALSAFWQLFMAIWKLVTFMAKRKTMLKVIRKMWKWNLEGTTEEESRILFEENRRDIMFCRFYYPTVAFTGFMALNGQLIIAAVIYLHSGDFAPNPPLVAKYYILDQRKLFDYILIYIWNAHAVYFIIHGSLAIDSLYSWLTHNMIAQFRILHLHFRLAAAQNNGQASDLGIRNAIKLHNRTIDLFDELNKAFGEIIFVKFTISCLQLCCLAYQFSRHNDAIPMLYNGFFLAAVTLQLILYCYNAQRVKDESKSVATTIYESFQWQEVNPANRRMLILSMLRAERSCDIKGVLFTVDLSLYLWVFRSAGSFITMLFTLDDKGVQTKVEK